MRYGYIHMGIVKDWQRKRLLQRSRLPEDAWRRTLTGLPALAGLSESEQRRLHELVILFLHEKSIAPAGGLELDDGARLSIAALACLLILNLDLDYYSGWTSIIVYPASFITHHKHYDSAGVEHKESRILAGEAWDRGPVVLSWEDVRHTSVGDGFNVIIHEFAHKLDMLNGEVNGFPPLHLEMRINEWTQAFSQAFEDLSRQVEAGWETAIDAYASESPAEFFAVVSEVFFETPGVLIDEYPRVYEQLCAFYRQNPLSRMPPLAV